MLGLHVPVIGRPDVMQTTDSNLAFPECDAGHIGKLGLQIG